MLRVQSYWNLCLSCLSPTLSSWRLGLTSGTQVWAPSSLCSHSGVCSGRSSLLQVAGGTPASRCASELCLCALRYPTGVGVPPEGDYLQGDLACSAVCGSRPHFSCGVGLECSSRDWKASCTARLPSPISEPRENSLWLGLLFFIPPGISSTLIQY